MKIQKITNQKMQIPLKKNLKNFQWKRIKKATLKQES